MKGQVGGCSMVGEVTPQMDILVPKSRRWGGYPHRRYGGVCCGEGGWGSPKALSRSPADLHNRPQHLF